MTTAALMTNSLGPVSVVPTAAPAPTVTAAPATPIVADALLGAADISELVAAFSLVTARLQATHEALTAEVMQLKGELAEANQQVERSKRLAALGEMAAGIAHEVRNPLGSIRLYAKMLRDDLADRPEQQTIAEKIGGAVVRLDAVVGDVLTFAREIKPRLAIADPVELFESATTAARGVGPEWERLEVDIKAAAKCPPLSVDAGMIRQALINLVRNAVEAMHESKSPQRRLILTARPVRARASADDAGSGTRGTTRPMIALSVRDTGPGISPDVAGRMFNPFFTTRAAGTGLGLAIVHRIADAHGGRVSVHSAATGPAGAIAEMLIPV